MKDLPTIGSKIEILPYPYILLICCIGIFFSFFLPRLVHKYLNFYYSINAPIFLTFTQFFAVSLLSAPSLYRTVFSHKKLSTNLFVYFITSITLLLSMALDNYSVHLLIDKSSNNKHFIFDNSFTIESLFKSPKVLPVMVGNIVFLKKKFSFFTVFSICIMVCGFVGVSLGDLNGTIPIYNDNYNYLGIAAIVASMTLEAIASNLEEYILIYCNSTQGEAISIIFSFGTVFTFVWSLIKGEFTHTIYQLYQLGNESKKSQLCAISYLAIYAFLGAIGIYFVFLSLKTFGSLQTVSLTSLRKVFNSCLTHFLTSDKQFTIWQSLSIFLSLLGYVMNIYHRILTPKNKDKLGNGLNRFNSNKMLSSSGGSGATRNLNDISDLNDSNEYNSPNYSLVNDVNSIQNNVDVEDHMIHSICISNKYNLLTNSLQPLIGVGPEMNQSEIQ